VLRRAPRALPAPAWRSRGAIGRRRHRGRADPGRRIGRGGAGQGQGRAMSDVGPALTLFSPAGALRSAAPLRRATARLGKLGFAVTVDEAATARMQRFAGDDDSRLATFERIAAARPSIALATRGGYGMTRLL